MWQCKQCSEQQEDSFDSCWSCGYSRDGLPPKAGGGEPSEEPLLGVEPLPHRAPSSTAPASRARPQSRLPASASTSAKSGSRLLMSRYTEAYLIARAITGIGTTVKYIAIIIGGGVSLFVVTVISQSMQYALGGILLGAIVAMPIYLLGILVSAQGQILKATLDTAVNTSQWLTRDEMRQAMFL